MTRSRVIITIEIAIRRDDDRYLMIVRSDDEDHVAEMLASLGDGLDFDVRADVLET